MSANRDVSSTERSRSHCGGVFSATIALSAHRVTRSGDNPPNSTARNATPACCGVDMGTELNDLISRFLFFVNGHCVSGNNDRSTCQSSRETWMGPVRPVARDATIATTAPPPGSLQRIACVFIVALRMPAATPESEVERHRKSPASGRTCRSAQGCNRRWSRDAPQPDATAPLHTPVDARGCWRNN